MKNLDFKGVQFYLFLPNFNTMFRKKISKRIWEYHGQVTLTVKDSSQYVIVSDNVIGYSIEKENLSQPKDQFNNSGSKLALNEHKLLHRENSCQSNPSFILTKDDVTDISLYKKFIQDQLNNKKNENSEVLKQFDDILKLKVPIVKITDLHHVLDFYESMTKFEWHLKRDDWNMLRYWINGEGLFIVTSK